MFIEDLLYHFREMPGISSHIVVVRVKFEHIKDYGKHRLTGSDSCKPRICRIIVSCPFLHSRLAVFCTPLQRWDGVQNITRVYEMTRLERDRDWEN